ncbi:MAG: hypothetical protein IJO26_05075 [Clostridium sp.]|nr:hypothetical protein [Clostridium sp.]
MSKKGFLEEKYIELNQLKDMLITYPDEYKDNIVDTMNIVCMQIETYLRNINKCNKINKI